MSGTYQLFVNGAAASPEFLASLASLEVEEHADLPGAMVLHLRVDRTDAGELSPLADAALAPYANLALVARAEGAPPECVFDGYVLSQKVHLERGAVGSHAEVWARDASWLMNLEERSRAWSDTTDAAVANAVFGAYGLRPAPSNTVEDSSVHTQDGHVLFQRATDIEFLRDLARRSGKLCRVVPGRGPNDRTGLFARPDLDAAPSLTIALGGVAGASVRALDFEWDVARPTAVTARQALWNDASPEGVSGDTSDAGLTPLAARPLAAFVDRPMTMTLSTTVDDAGELLARARSLVREASFFARCVGEADVNELGAVLRAGSLVELGGVGSLFAGRYLVWSVRHTIRATAHTQRFTLVRNAMGAAPTGGLS